MELKNEKKKLILAQILISCVAQMNFILNVRKLNLKTKDKLHFYQHRPPSSYLPLVNLI